MTQAGTFDLCSEYKRNSSHTCIVLRDTQGGRAVTHTCAKHSILLLQFVVAAHDIDHLGRRTALELALEVANLALKRFDMILGPLANGSLCFSVVGTLPLQLGGGEGVDAASSCS